MYPTKLWYIEKYKKGNKKMIVLQTTGWQALAQESVKLDIRSFYGALAEW